MPTYRVSTPGNPQFSGKAFGVQFTKGKAIVSPATIDPKYGYTTEQIAQSMRTDLGYDVVEVADAESHQHGEEQPAGDNQISIEEVKAMREEQQDAPPQDSPEERARQSEYKEGVAFNPDKDHQPKPSPYMEPVRLVPEAEQEENPVQKEGGAPAEPPVGDVSRLAEVTRAEQAEQDPTPHEPTAEAKGENTNGEPKPVEPETPAPAHSEDEPSEDEAEAPAPVFDGDDKLISEGNRKYDPNDDVVSEAKGENSITTEDDPDAGSSPSAEESEEVRAEEALGEPKTTATKRKKRSR